MLKLKAIFFFFLITFFIGVMDTNAQKKKIDFYDITFKADSNRTLKWLNDSLFTALMLNEYTLIHGLSPSYGLMDSFYKKMNPALNLTSRKLKYAQMIGRIKSQHKKFRKKIKKSDFVLRNSKLDSVQFGDFNLNDTIPFCEVIMFCSRKDKEFKIKYYSINIMGNWYLFEKLYFYNLATKPKKKKIAP